ncbi:hypothetical protein FACS189437_05500 [Bacteroidia bacterium]|nr:hypothetical protein FACS189437_05500 [Bacteroidia bacterium]
MKKMMFLMLALLIMGAANVNAQVTIGKDTILHAGAVLDLRVTNQGLKLPILTLIFNSQGKPINRGCDLKNSRSAAPKIQ